MLTRLLAVGVVAGGIYALSGISGPVGAAPTGLAGVGDTPSAVTDVRRRGGGIGRGGFGRGGRGFSGRQFGGGRAFHGGRGFYGGRRFGGSRRFYGGRHYGFRRHRGRNLFLYGALPFIGYQAYTGGYGYSCGWLWRRYRITGSRYWYRRWASCRYGY
ncbi:MAG: hypothetical protein ACKVP3_19445 [Hyphomicrobiaceae bacterium]